MAFSPVVQASLTEAACEALRVLGTTDDSDLANYFVDQFALLEASSDAELLRQMTTAWNIAKVQTRVREQQHPAPSASVKRPINDVAKQPLLLVARPKARLFPLAAIRTRKFTQAVCSRL